MIETSKIKAMEAGIKQIKASELFNFKQVNYINAR